MSGYMQRNLQLFISSFVFSLTTDAWDLARATFLDSLFLLAKGTYIDHSYKTMCHVLAFMKLVRHMLSALIIYFSFNPGLTVGFLMEAVHSITP